MTPDMIPMKRCASCGRERRAHELVDERAVCADGSDFHPVTIEWASFQRVEMERAEEIYDRCPNVDRTAGLPVPFDDAMPMSRQRCIDQAKVAIWTGRTA